MAAAPGIAGSRGPEAEGCFLALDEDTAEWFVQMNNTGGPVDVWEVRDVDLDAFVECSGYAYLPAVIPPTRLRLVRTDLLPVRT